MLNNPFFIEVSRPTGRYRTLELIPVYLEQGRSFVATRNYRIFVGYEPDALDDINGDALREQYFDNLELMDNDNPCYLGEIRFQGFAYYEWRYIGNKLTSEEVWQIVDLLQNCIQAYV